MSRPLRPRNPISPLPIHGRSIWGLRSSHLLSLALVLSSVLSTGCGIQIAAPAGKRGAEVFNPANFDAASANITNNFLTLRPGTRLIYEGIVVERGVDVPRRSEVTTTNLTKVISGIRTMVTYSVDYNNGQLVEIAMLFLAQDKTGTVWRMGEYPEEYQGGQLRDAPTWIHGIENAVAGVYMLATPTVGTDYSQGWAPSVLYADRGIVDKIGVRVCVQDNVCYDNAVVIAEYAPGEPGQQLKHYARGIGYIRETFRGEGERAREVLNLVQVEQLSDAALRSICQLAHALETSANDNSPDVYGRTVPLEPPTCP